MIITLNANLTEMHRRIVQAALLAPSAENMQPWQFLSDDANLTICLDPSRTLASDVDFMLDLTSLGTCTENAVIGGREMGYEPTITIVADRDQLVKANHPVPVVQLACSQSGQQDPLFQYLNDRCTSRRLKPTRIAQSQLEKFSVAISDFPGVQIDWVTEPNLLNEIAQLAGLGNRIRFEYQPFHQEFYGNVRIGDQDVKTTRDGLDLATLQLPPGIASLMAFMKRWPRMMVANWFGFSRQVARQAAEEVNSSGAVGIITVDDCYLESFLSGGRALERMWLTATAAGLGFHLFAAPAVFLAYAQRTDGSRLLPKHWRMAQSIQQRFFRAFPDLDGRTVQMMFRLGYGDKPSVRSLRRHIDDVLVLAPGSTR